MCRERLIKNPDILYVFINILLASQFIVTFGLLLFQVENGHFVIEIVSICFFFVLAFSINYLHGFYKEYFWRLYRNAPISP